ncbi:unnamed protein product [Oikopleura dioica]|uniref:Uncharacterized protein n=1 Tax=Oikopleura dioica TaxID=34765 RepID=E4XC50_OIKDI|nr:unnamed protein product [Oikopleura dioica]
MTSETLYNSGFKSSFQECSNSASASIPPASYSNNFGPGISIQTLRDPSDQRFRFNLKKREVRSKKNERKNEETSKKEASPDPVVENFVPPLPDYECPGAVSPPAGDQSPF